jgi:transcriptional regulator with XRE-family HTH domain
MALHQGSCLLPGIRKSRKKTQAQVCAALKKECGVEISPSYFSKIEKGIAPLTTLQARAICIVLACAEEQLYDYKQD